MSKVMIDITGGNLDGTFEINDFRDYIFIGIRNIVRKYPLQPNGEKIEIEEVRYFDVNTCNSSHYQTDYEVEYFKQTKDLNGYCFEN